MTDFELKVSLIVLLIICVNIAIISNRLSKTREDLDLTIFEAQNFLNDIDKRLKEIEKEKHK